MQKFDLLPKDVWDSIRMVDIIKAIKRRKDEGKEVPEEWIEEYENLAKIYQNKP